MLVRLLSRQAMRRLLACSLLIAVSAGVSPSAAGEMEGWNGHDGTLAVLLREGLGTADLKPLQGTCWLLTRNQDLFVLLLPPGFETPPALAPALVRIEPAGSHGEPYYLYHTSNPSQATFAGRTEVLFHHGRTVLLRTAERDVRLTTESRAHQRGWVQPSVIRLTPKPWPGASRHPIVPRVTSAADYATIYEMVHAVDVDSYVSFWQTLDDFGTRYTFAPENEDATDWLSEQFRGFGLATEIHAYEQYGTRRNVIAVLPGRTQPEKVFYLTGHFDSISDSPFTDAPGADDNASGVACLLEAARVMSQYTFAYTIKFVAFNGEEQGMHGSEAYAAWIAGQGEDVVGCINADMIAFPDEGSVVDDIKVYADSASISLGQALQNAVAGYLPESFAARLIVEEMRRSDHASFWDQGFVAVLAIEGSEEDGDWTPWYHTSQDRIENYPNHDFPTTVARALLATVAEIAGPVQARDPLLIIAAVEVDDDDEGSSAGNGNGVAEAGETIELAVTLRNVGSEDAVNVGAELKTDDDQVTVSVATTSFGTVPADRETADSQSPFVLSFDRNMDDGSAVALRLITDAPADTLDIRLPVAAPLLAFVTSMVEEGTGSDGDGIIEPGEQARLQITLINNGASQVEGVTATLSAESEHISVDGASGTFGDLPPGEEATAGGFSVTIDGECPELLMTSLNLVIEATGDFTDDLAFPFYVGFLLAEDVEFGENGWGTGVGADGFLNQWRLETSRNHTAGGRVSWKCGGTQNADYGDSLYAMLQTPAFPLYSYSTATFWHWMDAEISGASEGQCYDGGRVELQLDDDRGTWHVITPQGGYTHSVRTRTSSGPFPAGTEVFSGRHDWQRVTCDLSPFVGSAARLRFVFGSDGGIRKEGWYVDDLEITGPLPTSSTRVMLQTPQPNPAPGWSKLILHLPQPATAQLNLFDINGRLVRRLLRDAALPAGQIPVHWDGLDETGVRLSSGVYFARAEVGGENQTVRMVVIR